jgi:hypothetical protein
MHILIHTHTHTYTYSYIHILIHTQYLVRGVVFERHEDELGVAEVLRDD